MKLTNFVVAAAALALTLGAGQAGAVVYPVTYPGMGLAPTITEWNLGTVTGAGGTGVYASPPFSGAFGVPPYPPISVVWLTPIYVDATPLKLGFNPLVPATFAQVATVFALQGKQVLAAVGSPTAPLGPIFLNNFPDVDAFFVNSILGGAALGIADGIPGNGGIAGGPSPVFAPFLGTKGSDFDVTAGTAASPANGAQVEGHELGHILGLVHCGTAGLAAGTCPAPGVGGYADLMNPGANGQTALTAIQAATVDSNVSGLIQSPGNFIDIQPVTFFFAVPEPSTWAMMVAGFAGLGFLARRRNRRGCAAGAAV